MSPKYDPLQFLLYNNSSNLNRPNLKLFLFKKGRTIIWFDYVLFIYSLL